MHLDGRFDGLIRAVHFSIGHSGIFSGDVYATHITISGRMEGKIACDVLELLHGCHVSAEVQCQDLVIEKGAKFIGTSHGSSGSTLMAEQPHLMTNNLIPSSQVPIIEMSAGRSEASNKQADQKGSEDGTIERV